MIKVSATKLRNNLFDYLDKVANGETIIVERNNQDVARIISIKQVNSFVRHVKRQALQRIICDQWQLGSKAIKPLLNLS